jgi:undecaprenyl-diphosphatase
MNVIDEAFARFFAGLQQSGGGFWTPFFYAITLSGNYGVFFIAVALILLIFKKTRKSGAVALFAILLGFLIGNLLLKNVIARPRPFIDSGTSYHAWWQAAGSLPEKSFSFPSGHTSLAAAFGVSLFLCFPKKWSWAFLLLPLLMGASRIYFMVHYASDVFGGLLLGSIVAVVAYYFLRWLQRFPRIQKLFAEQ